MAFYYLMVEGTGLTSPDGTAGFIANRYEFAASEAEAINRVRRRVLRDWTTGKYAKVSESAPQVRIVESRPVSVFSFVRNIRQNRGHVFY